MKAILALDQGTTSSRAIVFGESGVPVSSAQAEFAQFFPAPAWVEHDANEIWASQRDTAAKALNVAATSGSHVTAIGITNQRETAVLWERKTGQPLCRAIVWQDRRTAALCDELKKNGHDLLIREKTGLVVDAYFSATKLKWMLDHVDGARAKAERGELAFGTIDSWLIFQLTGGKVHATDVSNASRTMLCNIHHAQWDDDLLRLFDVPRAVLPEIVSSSGVIGETACEGLPAGIPIAGVAGDQQAALFGQACHAPGSVKNTYGTGCFMLMNTGNEARVSSNRLLTTVAWRLAGHTAPTYALEGSVFIGGAVVQWLRDGLGVIQQSSEVESLAASVADSGGVTLVPAFAGLGAPHWDASARGLLIGLTRGTTRAHIARAALEAIALQSAELAAAMQIDADLPLGGVRVDGGAAVNNTLMQLQADLAQTVVTRPMVTETTALGAAYLAGLGVGLWPDLASLAQQWRIDRQFEPGISADEAAVRMARWQRAVERAKGWER
jgi:glycerol kinase